MSNQTISITVQVEINSSTITPNQLAVVMGKAIDEGIESVNFHDSFYEELVDNIINIHIIPDEVN